MEARVNDYALFLRKAAVEIKYENEVYFVVPQSAILLLIRENKLPEMDNEDPIIDF
jgi:predicted component of type VI protein secretion system